jgi:hypothetical protein
MIPTNLVLVDGLPGSGKSVTTQILCMHLVRAGHQATWYFEHQSSHPIYRYDNPGVIFQTTVAESERIHAQALQNWEKLTESLLDTSRIVILESTFFQTTIGWLQLMDLGREQIIGFVSRVSQIIDELNPALIYFYQDNLAEELRKTCVRRGEWFENFLVDHMAKTPYGRRTSLSNLDGVIEFYRQLRDISDELYSRLALRKLAIETTGGEWATYRRQISEFLLIPPIDPVFRPPMDCANLAGRYREITTGNEIGIGCDSDGFYFDEPSRPRLLHKEGNTFSIEGMCIDMSFAWSDSGSITELVFAGDLPDAASRWIRI